MTTTLPNQPTPRVTARALRTLQLRIQFHVGDVRIGYVHKDDEFEIDASKFSRMRNMEYLGTAAGAAELGYAVMVSGTPRPKPGSCYESCDQLA